MEINSLINTKRVVVEILGGYLGQLRSADTEEGERRKTEEITIENSGLIIGQEEEERVKISWHSTDRRDARNK